MTAEIVIMNRNAVAMAADSAVTIANGQKIYNSSNKLFMLSKYHPVGIMVYDSAEFLGVGWETIIKIYRNELGNKKFNTVEEYGNHFLKFLSTTDKLPFKNQCKESLYGMICDTLMQIIDTMRRRIGASTERDHTSEELQEKIYGEFFQAIFQSSEYPWGILDIVDLIKAHDIHLDKDFEWLFPKYSDFLSVGIFKKLVTMSVGILKKGDFLFPSSGIVLAGFGENEIFPSMVSWNVYGIVDDDRLIVVSDTNMNICHNNSVYIKPFAQGEMVERFIDGIDADFTTRLKTDFREILDLMQECGMVGKQFENKLYDYYDKKIKALKNDFSIPVINAVSVLPKTELANMAEALVGLTSIKRKVTFQEETVGGPIDVAIISKGDGFIWIKRKHYFQPELNHHFFKHYFEGQPDE